MSKSDLKRRTIVEGVDRLAQELFEANSQLAVARQVMRLAARELAKVKETTDMKAIEKLCQQISKNLNQEREKLL